MSRIDIAELNDFLHGLRSSNAEAKAMINKIKEAATNYSQDSSLKGEAVTTSKQYFSVFARASSKHWMKARSDWHSISASSEAK